MELQTATIVPNFEATVPRPTSSNFISVCDEYLASPPKSHATEGGDTLFVSGGPLQFSVGLTPAVEEEGSKLEEKEKGEVLLLKLGQPEHEQYVQFMLPKKLVDISFEDTFKNLKSLFSSSKSLFNRPYECFTIEGSSHEDHIDLAGRLNYAYHQADLEQATSQQIKALLFIKALTLPETADVHTRLLAQLDQKAEMTVQQLAEEYVRIMHIKNDIRLIGDVNSQHVAAPSLMHLPQHGMDAEDSGSLQDFRVRDPDLPSQLHYSAEAAEMEVIQVPGLVQVDGQGLRSIKEHLQDDGLVQYRCDSTRRLAAEFLHDFPRSILVHRVEGVRQIHEGSSESCRFREDLPSDVEQRDASVIITELPVPLSFVEVDDGRVFEILRK
ncbi:unnamed protein product [Schistocephalus solidus]|uniref:Band 7 protein n=1 Tax=Schistocephalus solidus TaxID=70667 RepID=A0A183T6N5_SCHSO|nr:unnamed protein product [Schistocephalus solidus]